MLHGQEYLANSRREGGGRKACSELVVVTGQVWAVLANGQPVLGRWEIETTSFAHKVWTWV